MKIKLIDKLTKTIFNITELYCRTLQTRPIKEHYKIIRSDNKFFNIIAYWIISYHIT